MLNLEPFKNRRKTYPYLIWRYDPIPKTNWTLYLYKDKQIFWMRLSWIKLLYSKINLIVIFLSLVQVQFIPYVVSSTSAKFPLLRGKCVEKSQTSAMLHPLVRVITHPVLMGVLLWGSEGANVQTHKSRSSHILRSSSTEVVTVQLLLKSLQPVS